MTDDWDDWNDEPCTCWYCTERYRMAESDATEPGDAAAFWFRFTLAAMFAAIALARLGVLLCLGY